MIESDVSIFESDVSMPEYEMNSGDGQYNSSSTLYCICEKRNDHKSPMVHCHLCDNWFHYDCVNFTQSPSKDNNDTDDYMCPKCDAICQESSIRPLNLIKKRRKHHAEKKKTQRKNKYYMS